MRSRKTRADFIRVRDALQRCVTDLTAAIEKMEAAGMETALLHGKTIMGWRVRELSAYGLRILSEIEDQARARLEGRVSQAEYDKERAARQAARAKAKKAEAPQLKVRR